MLQPGMISLTVLRFHLGREPGHTNTDLQGRAARHAMAGPGARFRQTI